MKKTKIIGALAVAALLAAGAAYAGSNKRGHDDDHDRGDHHREHLIEHATEKLSLTDEQEERLESLLEEFGDKRKAMRERTKTAMREVILQDEMSAEDAERLMTMRRESRNEMRAEAAAVLAAFHAELSPAQREKLADFAPRMLSRNRHHGKRHGRRHRGWF